jgi:hypothetical protein
MKSSTTVVIAYTAPDTGSAQPISRQISSASIFCLFAFADTQFRERQRLPLNLTEFMDGREISEDVLREACSGGPPYELEVHYDGEGNISFKGMLATFC